MGMKVCVLAALLTPLTAATLFQTPPTGLQISEFATGLNFPTSLVQLPDASILVAATAPTGASDFTNFYFGSGQLARFSESGSPVGVNPVLSGLPGPVTSVRTLGNLVAVATAGDGTFPGLASADISFFSMGTTPYSLVGSLHFSYPITDAAVSLTMATRSIPGSPGQFELVFGLQAGNTTGASVGAVTMSALVSAALPAGALYRMVVDTTSGSPVVQAPVQIASGLRNAGGILIDPDGNVYFNDNGYEDSLGTPVSADELNVITAAQVLAGSTFFGYAGNYTDANTGSFIGGAGAQALAAFLNLGGVNPVGAAEIVLAPSGFPTGWNNGLFIGFHGNFTTAGGANLQNPVLYYSFDTHTFTTFISAGRDGVGHLDALWATSNALYLGDFSSGNGFAANSGVVYKIEALPEPGTLVLGMLGFGLLAPLARRRARGQVPRLHH